MSPQERNAARTLDRIKYARRMNRDSRGFRAKRCVIQNRYDQRRRSARKRPGVQVELIF
jgi:hypothetical protein